MEKWYAFTPRDAEMRIPDQMRDCTCFLSVDSRGTKLYGGTAFFMSFAQNPVRSFTYLVTAKHCVTRAFEDYGNLHVRLNTVDGSSEEIELDREWSWSDDDGVDVAVRPWELDIKRHKQGSIDSQSSAHEKNIQASAIGIGNEALVIGLFRLHHGVNRNIPIVRQGLISSMPEEPLKYREGGREYRAYLAEVQSISGLSGSPVFAHVPAMQLLEGQHDARLRENMKERYPAGFLYLLGLIRGHFDAALDMGLGDSAMDSVHTGIATVTPIEEVIKIVKEDKRLTKLRRETVEREERKAGATLDADFDEHPFTQADFEAALKKVARKIEPKEKSK